ncbi:MAG: SH3 domain-containing protein [Bacteroidota bacterium]
MFRLVLITTLTLFSFLLACKDTNSSESTEHTSSQVDSTAMADIKPEGSWLYAWVDKLRMRDTPNTKGKVLAELKEGEALRYFEEKTDFTEKINLRGQLFDEPWLKVQRKDGTEGWVYGGALRSAKPDIDEHPSPYDECMALRISGKSYTSCMARVQKAQLKKDRQYVSQDKNGLQFRLLSGEEKQLLHDEQAGPGEAARYEYRYYIPQMGYFVVETSGHEWGEYLLVNDKSGQTTRIWGYPKASPDYKYLIIANPDLEPGFEINGIQLWGFTPKGFQRIWERELTDFEPVSVRWLNEESAEIQLRPPLLAEAARLRKAHLKRLEDGEWVLVDSQ